MKFRVKKKRIRVIISFDSILNRDEFVLKFKDFELLNKFDLIPAINLILTKAQIKNLQDHELIKQIEEDQKLYLSMLEVIETLEIPKYRKSQIVFMGNQIRIGIIDNGINQEVDSISNVVLTKYSLPKAKEIEKETINKSEIYHGTLMTNIIANQYMDFKDNVIGIAPNAKIIDLDVSRSDGEYYFSNILKMFDLIIDKNIFLDTLLISFTTLEPSDGKDILSRSCDLLVNKGITIVCPAGNFGPESNTIGSPSAAEKVITIGALSKNDNKIAYFSGRGPTLDNRTKPNFCFPGSNVEIPLKNNLRLNLSGTSVSAAIGAGIVALLKEYNRKIGYNEILEVFKKSRLDLNYAENSQGIGTSTIVKIFENLGLIQAKLVSYDYILRRSLKLSIEYLVLFVVIFYLMYFFYLF